MKFRTLARQLGLALALATALPALAQSPASTKPDTADAAPHWITLGVAGGPIIRGDDAMSSNALVVGKDVYLFDVGYGAMRQLSKAGLALPQVKALFISHHHPDHNADLSFFLVSKWLFGGPSKIRIYGPPGTQAMVADLIKANAPTLLASYPVSGKGNKPLAELFEVVDLPAQVEQPRQIYRDGEIKVSTIGVDHFQVPPSIPLTQRPRSYAFRADTPGRSFAYTGDTGNTSRLLAISRGADVLVSEVIDNAAIQKQLQARMKDAPVDLREKIIANLEKNHLAPSYIGQLAAEAQVKEVVLTHFVPPLDTNPDPEAYRRDIRAEFHGQVKYAHELESF